MKGLKDGGRGRSLESFEKVFLFFFSFFLSSKRPFRADYFVFRADFAPKKRNFLGLFLKYFVKYSG